MNMRKIICLIIAGFLAVTVWAQNSETRTPGSFRGIKVSEGIDVYLQKGSKESVRITATGVAVENVVTEISDKYLRIHMREGRYRGQMDVKVYVTYVQIERLSASSAGTISTEGILKAEKLDISASSAGNMELELDVNELSISVSSAAEIELKGKCKTLNADASSAGEIDAYDFNAQSVVAQASSAGSIHVHAVNSLVANASSGGDVRYKGNPEKFMANSSSGGSVKRSD